jgi:hypothetical protein
MYNGQSQTKAYSERFCAAVGQVRQSPGCERPKTDMPEVVVREIWSRQGGACQHVPVLQMPTKREVVHVRCLLMCRLACKRGRGCAGSPQATAALDLWFLTACKWRLRPSNSTPLVNVTFEKPLPMNRAALGCLLP